MRSHLLVLGVVFLSACGAPRRAAAPEAPDEERALRPSEPDAEVLLRTGALCPPTRTRAISLAYEEAPVRPPPARPGELDERPVRRRAEGPSLWVRNGAAYDCGALELRGVERVVLPPDVTLLRGAEAGIIRLEVRRTVSFYGHPAHPPTVISPSVARRTTGIAYRIEGTTLYLGSFGAWDSHIEGGVSVDMRVTLPPDVVAAETEDLCLSGEASSVGDDDPPEGLRGGWPGATRPAPGWTAVPTVPSAEAVRLEDDGAWHGQETSPLGAADSWRRLLREVARCRVDALRGQADLAGRVEVEILPAPSGRVRAARLVTNETESFLLGACVTSAVRDLRLPCVRGEPVPVLLPFVFQP